MTQTEREAIRAELDRQLAPLLRAQERGAGSGEPTIRLRETQRKERFLEAARRQDVREAERDAKALRKQERKVFERLGMTREQAKLAARGGAQRGPRPIEGLLLDEATMRHFEADMRVSEANRIRERKSEKRDRKDAAEIFQRLGLSESSAMAAAIGRR